MARSPEKRGNGGAIIVRFNLNVGAPDRYVARPAFRASGESRMEKLMTNPTEQIERHLIRASGSATLAFGAATVAYIIKGVHWALLHIYGLQAVAFDNVIGAIAWMGGPMDVGFYTFLASEGIQSMVFAAIERNEWRRRLEEERAERERERAEKERARAEAEKERAAREAAERRIQELEKRLADNGESRRGDAS